MNAEYNPTASFFLCPPHSQTSGPCLKAFGIAMKQAYAAGLYTSTEELQILCRALCVFVRDVPTLCVRVDAETPHSLCNHDSRLRKEVVFFRSAARLKWDLGMLAFGSVSMIFLMGLKFGDSFNQPIDWVSWPASLQKLSFGDHFNWSIAGVAWPPAQKQLSLGSAFNKTIVRVACPPAQKQLSFGSAFNQPIVKVAWPASLQKLSFGHAFNQPIVGVAWPVSLQELSFG